MCHCLGCTTTSEEVEYPVPWLCVTEDQSLGHGGDERAVKVEGPIVVTI